MQSMNLSLVFISCTDFSDSSVDGELDFDKLVLRQTETSHTTSPDSKDLKQKVAMKNYIAGRVLKLRSF